MSLRIAPRRTSEPGGWTRRLGGGLTGAVIGGVVVLAVLGPTAQVTLGPFLLSSSNPSVSLSFPDCAIVTVHWNVVTGPRANFSVGSGEVALASDCHGPPPSSATCPVPYCGGNGTVSMGPGPICFESGFAGTCSFTATQPIYGFVALSYPWSIGNATVAFTINYTQAII
jgi:hypothetical protein